jgi:hypothetical protein
LLLAALGLTACTTVESISISQMPEQDERKATVEAHASTPIIFAIPFGTGYIDTARDELLGRCASGAIEGVLTKFQTTNYFLGLVESQQVSMSGYCVKEASVRAKGKGKKSRRAR